MRKAAVAPRRALCHTDHVTLLRHVVAVAVLPFVATVVIPAALAWRDGITLDVGDDAIAFLTQGAGTVLLLVGTMLFVGSLRRFAGEGEGTLAPWDPPRNLVVSGLYRYVRNPMISGVLFVLVGEALILRSRVHALWALLFFVANAVYIPNVEEPRLARRFGEQYREYRRHVPRLVPRLHPWTPPSDVATAAPAARGASDANS
jgi:protein-S-isoprenylcysteine O-methyltransferase Ste14